MYGSASHRRKPARVSSRSRTLRWIIMRLFSVRKPVSRICGSLSRKEAARRIPKEEMGKPPLPPLPLREIDLLLGGVDEHRLVRGFAVVDLRAGELEALGLHFGGRVIDEQHGEAVGRHLAE